MEWYGFNQWVGCGIVWVQNHILKTIYIKFNRIDLICEKIAILSFINGRLKV